MTLRTSNRLTDLSERIREARALVDAASLEAAEQTLEAGLDLPQPAIFSRRRGGGGSLRHRSRVNALY